MKNIGLLSISLLWNSMSYGSFSECDAEKYLPNKNKSYEEIAQCIESLTSHERELLAYATTLRAKGYKDEAYEGLSIGIKLYPDNVLFIHEAAITKEWLNDLDAAFELHLKAYRLDEKHLPTLLGLQRVTRWLGLWKESLSYLEQLKNMGYPDEEYWYQNALLAFDQMELIEAKDMINRAYLLNHKQEFQEKKHQIENTVKNTIEVYYNNQSLKKDEHINSRGIRFERKLSAMEFLNVGYDYSSNAIIDFEVNEFGIPADFSLSHQIYARYSKFNYNNSWNTMLSLRETNSGLRGLKASYGYYYNIDSHQKFGLNISYSGYSNSLNSSIIDLSYIKKITDSSNIQFQVFTSKDFLGISSKAVLVAYTYDSDFGYLRVGGSFSQTNEQKNNNYFMTINAKIGSDYSVLLSYTDSRVLNVKDIRLSLMYHF